MLGSDVTRGNLLATIVIIVGHRLRSINIVHKLFLTFFNSVNNRTSNMLMLQVVRD